MVWGDAAGSGGGVSGVPWQDAHCVRYSWRPSVILACVISTGKGEPALEQEMATVATAAPAVRRSVRAARLRGNVTDSSHGPSGRSRGAHAVGVRLVDVVGTGVRALGETASDCNDQLLSVDDKNTGRFAVVDLHGFESDRSAPRNPEE